MTTSAGKFVWFELVTTDRARAEAFYGEVLGWKTAPMSMGSESYTLITNAAAPIGGLVAAEGKTPSHWIAYAAVADVDAGLARAGKLGGTTEPAFDVPTVGRMAKVTDPQGGALYLFRPEAGEQQEPTGAGTFYWNELHTSDPAAALRFYEGVIGYTHEDMNMGPEGTYHVLASGDAKHGGIMKAKDGVPTMWLAYVAVDDCDATAGRVARNGGKVVQAPTDIPGIGRFAIFTDPTGAALAIIKPAPAKA